MTKEFDLNTMLMGTTVTNEQIRQLPCNILTPYHNHKFELYSGERLDDMIASIKKNGIICPIVVQPLIDGKYEILIGHNRWNAAKLAGVETVPAIVKDGLSEEEAEMYVIESNVMQRGFDNLKISEQAAVVAKQHKEMFSQGKRNDIINELKIIENITSSPLDTKLKSGDSKQNIAEDYNISRSSVARLIRIDKLVPELKQLVDNGNLCIRAAVELSFLSNGSQITVAAFAEKHKIDIKKAVKIRRAADTKGSISLAYLKLIFDKQKSSVPKPCRIALSPFIVNKYFDTTANENEIRVTIEKALAMYFASNIND